MKRVETFNKNQLIVYFLIVFEALEEFSLIHTPSASSRSAGATNRLAGETCRQRFAALWEFLRVIEELEAARPSTIPCRSLRTPAA